MFVWFGTLSNVFNTIQWVAVKLYFGKEQEGFEYNKRIFQQNTSLNINLDTCTYIFNFWLIELLHIIAHFKCIFVALLTPYQLVKIIKPYQ